MGFQNVKVQKIRKKWRDSKQSEKIFFKRKYAMAIGIITTEKRKREKKEKEASRIIKAVK
jgi:phosphoribosylanthranilate isomerase